MNLFTRKVHLFCVSNIMLSFVCTGFLGVNGISNRLDSTTEAHEISLTSSDTEPVSHNGEGEKSLAFITKSLEAAISEQEESVSLLIEGEENEFAFITKSVEAVINQQESALADKKVETKKTSSKTTSNKKTTTSSTKKTTTKKSTTKTVSYTKPSYSSVTGEAIVSFAKQFMGLRYVHAGRSLKTGTDCSGFTMLIYREFGVSLPGTVGGQIGKGKYVAKKNLQKGDLVFYRGKSSRSASHVAIYIGNNTVIHESKPGVGVKTSPLNMTNMYYVTARRVINSKATQIAQSKLEEQNKNNVVTDGTSNNTNNTNSTNIGTNNNDNNVVISATATPSVSPVPTPMVTPAPTTAPKPTAEPTPKVEAVATENTEEGSN